MPGEHAGHRRRMRERFMSQGLEGFAPHEVLELILFYAIPQRNVNELAHRLMAHFGTLHGVLEAPVEELVKVEGIGEYAATLISLFLQVATQVEQSRAGERETLGSRSAAKEHCKRLLTGFREEHFYMVCLNGQMQVICDAFITRGSLSEVPTYPRLVVNTALRHNAHTVVLCHNHPGGSLEPSEQDVEMTIMLKNILAAVEVMVADHIIVADGQTLSMSTGGYLNYAKSTERTCGQAADSSGEVRVQAQRKRKGTKES